MQTLEDVLLMALPASAAGNGAASWSDIERAQWRVHSRADGKLALQSRFGTYLKQTDGGVEQALHGLCASCPCVSI